MAQLEANPNPNPQPEPQPEIARLERAAHYIADMALRREQLLREKRERKLGKEQAKKVAAGLKETVVTPEKGGDKKIGLGKAVAILLTGYGLLKFQELSGKISKSLWNSAWRDFVKAMPFIAIFERSKKE